MNCQTKGISEVYGGLSFNLFDWVSLGANVYYMFGDVINSRSVSFSESEHIVHICSERKPIE